MATTFDGFKRLPGHVTLAVAFQGQQPFLAGIPSKQHIEFLKEAESAFKLKRSDRTNKASQIRLRELAYVMVQDKGVAEAARGLATAIYWLAINHYDQGEAIRSQLSDLLAEEDCAVISVMVTGDAEGMRWGFAVGSEPLDFSDMMPLVPDTQPLVLSASPGAGRVIN